MDLEQALARHVSPEPTSGCWLWTGNRTRGGYGLIDRTTAHRWVYRRLIGPVPPQHDLHHRCRLRACVNPAHLEPMDRHAHKALDRLDRLKVCRKGHPMTPETIARRREGGQWCRLCRAEYKRRYNPRYYAENRPRIRAQQREYSRRSS